MALTRKDIEEDAAKCGVLKFVSVDLEEWHFESSEKPGEYHTVHLADWELNGGCSCPNFDLTIRPLIRDKIIRLHTARAKCKHIKRAERILCYRSKKILFVNQNPTSNPK